MDKSPVVTHPLITAVRAAESACLTATTDDERRTAALALYTAGVALSQRVKRLHDPDTFSGWLLRASDWLDANQEHPEHFDRECRWIAALEEYRELLGALVDCRAMVATVGVEIRETTEEPMAQGGLL